MAEKEGRGNLLEWLRGRYGRAGEALYSFTGCLLVIALSGLVAALLGQPLIFPSLGPTAFLFFETPLDPRSSPRNTLIGHLIGLLAGAFSLAIFGLVDAPSILQEGVTAARVGAAAFSVALTGGAQLLLKASHPPAGATVLIVSLGLLQTPREMGDLMAGVVLITIAGWLLNRAAGVPVPLWAAKEEQ